MRVSRAHGGDLQDMARDYRVIVVMTTIPPRIQRIEPVLDAMLSQTWPVERLYLSVPHRYNRTGELYVIPEWLWSKPGVSIMRCEDLGPGTHLLNGLRIERDPWSFMVVVDDDHIYSPDLVETLMRAALAHPGNAVAAQGFLSVPGLQIGRDSPRYLHDQGFAAGPVLVSYLGVVYQRGFFDDSVFDYSKTADQCKYQDDMWFSAHLARKGIGRVVLGAALGVQELRDMHLGPESLTHWQENKPREVSAQCNDSLLRRLGSLWACRPRLVLALGGLPPRDPSASRSGAEVGQEWRRTLEALRLLPISPDLTYLCTDTIGGSTAADGASARRSAADHAGKEQPALGWSFWLDGVLVMESHACLPRPAEPGVGQLLRDPLRWEGDPSTVVILGALGDLVSQSADLAALTECASSGFPTQCSVAEGAGAEEGESMGAGPASVGAVEGSPFCRIGELAAVTIGALSSKIPAGRTANA